MRPHNTQVYHVTADIYQQAKMPSIIHQSMSFLGAANGNPLQCSCLETPRDGGALVGCHLWGCREQDTTEATQQHQQQHSPCTRPAPRCTLTSWRVQAIIWITTQIIIIEILIKQITSKFKRNCARTKLIIIIKL